MNKFKDDLIKQDFINRSSLNLRPSSRSNSNRSSRFSESPDINFGSFSNLNPKIQIENGNVNIESDHSDHSDHNESSESLHVPKKNYDIDLELDLDRTNSINRLNSTNIQNTIQDIQNIIDSDNTFKSFETLKEMITFIFNNVYCSKDIIIKDIKDSVLYNNVNVKEDLVLCNKINLNTES